MREELSFRDFFEDAGGWSVRMAVVVVIVGLIVWQIIDYYCVRTPRFESDFLNALAGRKIKYYPEAKSEAKKLKFLLPKSLERKEIERILAILPEISFSSQETVDSIYEKVILLNKIVDFNSTDKSSAVILDILELNRLDDSAPGEGIYAMCRNPEKRELLIKAIKKELPETALPKSWEREDVFIWWGLIAWFLVTFSSFLNYVYMSYKRYYWTKRKWYSVPWYKLGTYMVILGWLPGIVSVVVFWGAYRIVLAIAKIEFTGWRAKGRKGILKMISWQSFLARRIAAKIALLEREKGIFSQEIERIKQAVFPLDVILALFYLRKARMISKNWEVASQEKAEVKFIYQEIKKLAGKLIPEGGEDALTAISLLKKRAVEVVNNYLKNHIDYQKARKSLIEILDELGTVGDILEVRKPENQITYYSLLGIEPQAGTEEIKTAYRSVIAAVHPDHHQDNQHLQTLATMINVAYATLSNPSRREIYDKQIGF